MPDDERSDVATVDITPNMPALFSGFLRDARLQAEAATRKSDTEVKLEDLQAVLSRLNVSAAAITSTDELTAFREALDEMTGLVGAEATRRSLDEDAEDSEE